MVSFKNVFLAGIFLSWSGYWTHSMVDGLNDFNPRQLAIGGLIATVVFGFIAISMYKDQEIAEDTKQLLSPKIAADVFTLLRATVLWLTAAQIVGLVVCNLGLIVANTISPESISLANLQPVRDVGVIMTYIGLILITVALIAGAAKLAALRDDQLRKDVLA